jgi:hypothetical protein
MAPSVSPLPYRQPAAAPRAFPAPRRTSRHRSNGFSGQHPPGQNGVNSLNPGVGWSELQAATALCISRLPDL